MNELPNPTFALSPVAMPRGSLHPGFLKTLAKDGGLGAPPIAFLAPLAAAPAGIKVSWARHQDEVRQAQRLRYQVFAVEMGARLPKSLPGHDIDRFDDYCEHLLVRDAASGEVIGTYRVLPPEQARRIGSTYSDAEFDLQPLDALRSRMVELGRSCVHSRHRHGGVILALWGALAEFMARNQLDTMMGCASIPMHHAGVPCGHAAASIWRQVSQTHLAAAPYQVTPRLALPVEKLGESLLPVEPPALIRGYLRLGAKVLGPPAWDPEFNSADLPLMLRITDLPGRFRKPFGPTPVAGLRQS